MASVVVVNDYYYYYIRGRSARRQRIGYCFLNCDWSHFYSAFEAPPMVFARLYFVFTPPARLGRVDVSALGPILISRIVIIVNSKFLPRPQKRNLKTEISLEFSTRKIQVDSSL